MTSHDTTKQRGPHLYSLVCAAKTEEASMIIRDPFKQGSLPLSSWAKSEVQQELSCKGKNFDKI